MAEPEELKLALESLKGELKRLDTVAKMGMAEQRRINSELYGALARQASQIDTYEHRLDKLQVRLATYTGGLIALWLMFQILKTFLR